MAIKSKMNNTGLYKEFYFREIDRKHELNNAVNVPILLISGIITVHFYLYSLKIDNCTLLLCKVLSGICLCSLIYSIYFLSLSFSNLYKTHTYEEIANMSKLHTYQQNLLLEKKKKKAIKDFNKYLDEELSRCAGENFIINQTRSRDLAKAKQGIFISIILTIILSIIFIISII